MGLCPLHTDHKPSFLVDSNKGLFYCYGCGRGGDVIRFAELYHQVNFPQALMLLRHWCGLAPLLNAVIDFYRIQLHRYNESMVYLDQRGLHSSDVLEHMRIGYAPGGGLRSWLTQLGYPLSVLRQAGLITAAGYDRYIRCIIFPLESKSLWPHHPKLGVTASLYGRIERWFVPMGASPAILGGDSCGRSVRLRRVVAGWLSQCHLLTGKPSQRPPVPATV